MLRKTVEDYTPRRYWKDLEYPRRYWKVLEPHGRPWKNMEHSEQVGRSKNVLDLSKTPKNSLEYYGTLYIDIENVRTL